jgi:hypothetical protein
MAGHPDGREVVRLIGSTGAIALVAVVRLAAQQPDTLPIDTDRPDFTDGVHSVAPGRIQLETGYTYQQGRGPSAANSRSFPEALVRVGITSRAEIRVGENYLVDRDAGVGAATSNGFDDLYLGTKIGVIDQHGAQPALSVEAQARVPTGQSAVSGNTDRRLLPGGAILLGWESSGPWSAGIELFATRTADAHGQGVASLSVQYQAAARVQFYGECFSIRPIGAGEGAEQYANSGILVLLSRNLQIDARAGVGLNQQADRYFVGAGVAVRR